MSVLQHRCTGFHSGSAITSLRARVRELWRNTCVWVCRCDGLSALRTTRARPTDTMAASEIKLRDRFRNGGAVKISGDRRGLRPEGVPARHDRVLKSGVSQN